MAEEEQKQTFLDKLGAVDRRYIFLLIAIAVIIPLIARYTTSIPPGAMVQTMLDYGETMSSLRDGQWVVIAAFLKGADYFKERQISRLILKAKIDDLRDYSAGRLSESAARSRVLIEEY